MFFSGVVTSERSALALSVPTWELPLVPRYPGAMMGQALGRGWDLPLCVSAGALVLLYLSEFNIRSYLRVHGPLV